MAFSSSTIRHRKRFLSDPFTDLLFNALLGFTFLFLVAIMYMNPTAKSGIIDPKAEYIITITWPDNSPDDVDIWVEDPTGQILWYRAPEQGLLHLDRDDRGNLNDTIRINGEEIQNPLNQEVVTLRGTVTGEYVVNLHYYQTQTNQPVPVSVRVAKVNPALEIVFYETLTLEKLNDELTAVRFTVKSDGTVGDINSLPKKLVNF